MKKAFFSALLAVCSLTAGAQSLATKAPSGAQLKAAAKTAATVKKAPAKSAGIASNQRLVGYYTSDAADEYGLGVGTYDTTTVKPAIELYTEDYQHYYGAKVVGVRYYLAESEATGVEVYQVGSKSLTLKASKDSTVTTKGWHTVLFDKADQFELTSDYTELRVAYVVNQKAANVFPIGYNPENLGRPLVIYMNIPAEQYGSGTAWYLFGGYTPAIQLVLESDQFPTNAVVPGEMADFTTSPTTSRNHEITFTSLGTTLSNFDYTITQDGQTSDEVHVALPTPITGCGEYTAAVTIPATATVGSHESTVTVTKVNGVANETAFNTTTATNKTLAKTLHKATVVEEATGTRCGWCPRGHVGMANLRNTFGDKFVGVAVHRYNSSDPMYTNNYASIIPSGQAPVCYLNRSATQLDPYYGSNNDIREDFEATLVDLPEVGVSVSGMFSVDFTTVNATAQVESLVDGNYSIAFVLVADSLTGTANTWKQSNYFCPTYKGQYHNYTKEYLEETLPDLAFLWDAGALWETSYNDVAIASSYSGSTNNATLDALIAGNTTTADYTLTMPTKASLQNAVRHDLVYVVAIVMDSTGAVVNAAKAPVKIDPAGIQDFTADEANGNTSIVARYNQAGQLVNAPVKGLNILKLANGTTRKVIVK